MRAFDIAEIAKGLFAGAEQLPDRARPGAGTAVSRLTASAHAHAGAKIACTMVAKGCGRLPLGNLQAVDISTIDEVGTI
jgi:hypothetical protein